MIVYNGYRITESNDRGGKAGRGRNKTKTMQVFKDSCLVKQFRFKIGTSDDAFEREWSIGKAKGWIDNINYIERKLKEATG